MAEPLNNLLALLETDGEARTHDEIANLKPQATTARSEQIDRNSVGHTTFDLQKVQMIATQAKEQYGAMACVVAIESRTLLSTCSHVSDKEWSIVACAGNIDCINLQQPGDSDHIFQFFHYNIRRKIPVIISDVANDRRFEDHPLVKKAADPLRFYASAPVVLAKTFAAYVGAVTIIDNKPRHAFSVDDGEALVKKADEVASILSEA